MSAVYQYRETDNTPETRQETKPWVYRDHQSDALHSRMLEKTIVIIIMIAGIALALSARTSAGLIDVIIRITSGVLALIFGILNWIR
jgi:hypothetical protein